MQRTTNEVLHPSHEVHLAPHDSAPMDQTPPPDHEEFESVAARGCQAMKERFERRRRSVEEAPLSEER
jgi:hypothetical protein